MTHVTLHPHYRPQRPQVDRAAAVTGCGHTGQLGEQDAAADQEADYRASKDRDGARPRLNVCANLAARISPGREACRLLVVAGLVDFRLLTRGLWNAIQPFEASPSSPHCAHSIAFTRDCSVMSDLISDLIEVLDVFE